MVSVLAVMAGLGLGAGIISLIEKRDDRFTSVIEVNATLGDAIVGMLPEVAHRRHLTGYTLFSQQWAFLGLIAPKKIPPLVPE